MRFGNKNDATNSAFGTQAPSHMEELTCTSQPFNLPVKRSRPVTPLQAESSFQTWDDSVYGAESDLQYVYDYEADIAADWASAGRVTHAGAGDEASRPKMRTGCIPCLYVCETSSEEMHVLMLDAVQRACHVTQRIQDARERYPPTGA